MITSSVSDVCIRFFIVDVVDSSFIRFATLLILFADADINEDIDIEGDEYVVDLMLVLLSLPVSRTVSRRRRETRSSSSSIFTFVDGTIL